MRALLLLLLLLLPLPLADSEAVNKAIHPSSRPGTRGHLSLICQPGGWRVFTHVDIESITCDGINKRRRGEAGFVPPHTGICPRHGLTKEAGGGMGTGG